jgi:hypothetical protein
VNEIVVVHGVGRADQEFIQPVDALIQVMGGQVRFIDLSNLPLTEIKARVATLPRSSVVLYTLMFEDAAGVKYRPIDALRELTAASVVPVISGYDQFIGTGTIGGYLYSIDQQARAAAQIGLRILRGEAAGAIPIYKDQTNRFIFDHPALQRFGIPLSALPPDSIIKNRQYSVWERYWSQITAIAHSFNNQLGVVIGNLELAIDSLPQGAEYAHNLQAAMGAAQKSAEVSGLMLTYLGHSFDNREPLDLSEVCRRNLPLLQSSLPGLFAGVCRRSSPETGQSDPSLGNGSGWHGDFRSLAAHASIPEKRSQREQMVR